MAPVMFQGVHTQRLEVCVHNSTRRCVMTGTHTHAHTPGCEIWGLLEEELVNGPLACGQESSLDQEEGQKETGR